jgi:hypothetical protein
MFWMSRENEGFCAASFSWKPRPKVFCITTKNTAPPPSAR